MVVPAPANRRLPHAWLALCLFGCEEPAHLGRLAIEAPRPPVGEASPEPKDLTISAVGDCTLGSTHGTFAREIERHGGDLRYPFSGVVEVLGGDDLTIANLETPLTTRPRQSGVRAPFRGEPGWARMLALGGVELVNVANNHSHDCGGEGHRETLAAVGDAGVGVFGRELVHTTTVRGVEVVNLGFTGGHIEVRDTVVRAVADHKRQDNLVIVSFHWGGEEVDRPTPVQYRLGRTAVDAGADLVLGHHPHVLQGIESYRGKRIVYSLGNFVFGGDSNPSDYDSIIYQARFELRDGRAVQTGETIVPVSISSSTGQNDYRPRLLRGAERDRVLAKLARLSQALAPAVR